MTDAELDAIRVRDRTPLQWYERCGVNQEAIQDRRALLSHIYELTKQRAQDAEEIRRLRGALIHIEMLGGPTADIARKAIYGGSMPKAKFVVYRRCDKHLSVPGGPRNPPDPPRREVCPICEPPKGAQPRG